MINYLDKKEAKNRTVNSIIEEMGDLEKERTNKIFNMIKDQTNKGKTYLYIDGSLLSKVKQLLKLLGFTITGFTYIKWD